MGSAMAEPHLMVFTVDWSKMSGVLNLNIDLYIGDNKFVMKKLIKFILTI